MKRAHCRDGVDVVRRDNIIEKLHRLGYSNVDIGKRMNLSATRVLMILRAKGYEGARTRAARERAERERK